MSDIQEQMSSKTKEELLLYIGNPTRYRADYIKAAVDELNNRGQGLTEEQTQKVKEVLTQKDKYDQSHPNVFSSREEQQDNNPNFKNYTTEETAPELYSPIAVRIFSVLGSFFFGSILMSMNLHAVNKKKPIVYITLLTIALWAVLVLAYEYFELNFSIATIAGMIWGELLVQLFWNKHIGKGTKFRARSIYPPLFIGLFLFATITIIALVVK